VGEELQPWRRFLGTHYAGTMRIAVGSVIDQHVAELITVRLRRRRPLLKFVPASWIFRVVAPEARRLRRSFLRGVVAVAASIAVLIVLITLGS
jgi:hypothetical protein